MDHFSDRLLAAIERTNAPVCVGIDPVPERLPQELQVPPDADHRTIATALYDFGAAIVDVVSTHVPAVKINVAYFECYRGPGLDAYFGLVQYAQQNNLLVIGDSKRGDVGHTADRYALAHLGPDIGTPDAATVHTYLGRDGVEPYINQAAELGKGIFALVQTSNAGAAAVQDWQAADEQTVSARVATLVHGWADQPSLIGESGYSSLGAVVAPRDVGVARTLRHLMPRSLFLVPGFGTQGFGAEDVRHCFDATGRGAIVNASRSVIYCYESESRRQQHADDWRKCIESASIEFGERVASAIK